MNTNYLLDTCAWIDAFTAPELLKPSVRKLLSSQRLIHVASISLLEVARKEAVGQLIFGMPLADWFRIALPQNRVKVIELSPEISIDATRLPEWSHKDPGDQLVVATARTHRLTVLTSNGKILAYPHVQSLASRK
ncbi:MAG: type II toxin-antitoxin system VapC family toxin [Akkermansiaceae bacterium]|nr:type II toxin-antitoxin system VapC family toxin [Akkermansiaceae bacterium]